MHGLRTLTRHWPLASAIAISALAWLTIRFGVVLADRLLPGSSWNGTVRILPAAGFAAALLFAGDWWRGAGFFRPVTRPALRLGWPLALLFGWMVLLVAWLGRHDWFALSAKYGLVAFWEETVFRGVVLVILIRRGTKWALFGSATLFMAVHWMVLREGWPATVRIWGLLWPFVIGLLFAAWRLRVRSIWPMIAAHWLLNLLNDTSPKPMTFSGAAFLGISVELMLFAVLLAAHACFLMGWRIRLTRAFSYAAAVAILLLVQVGLLFLGGPRPGWEGAPYRLELRLKLVETSAGWSTYDCLLRLRSDRASIESFSIAVPDGARVKDLEALAGGRRWSGTWTRGGLIWLGGGVPETTYRFRCSFRPKGEAEFRLAWCDRYGRSREWASDVDWPSG